jgi:hypothetical protein
MATHAAIAQVPLYQLPVAGQPLGIIPDAVMLSQGAGCSAHLQPCSAVQSPSLRIGQPTQTDVPPAAPFAYQPWIQTETNPPTLRQWLGTGWGTIGALDTSGAIWTPPIGGGTATTLSASSTIDLTSVPQSVVTVAGNATISGFGAEGEPSSVPANWNIPGTLHQLLFSGYAELKHSTSLTLPTAANITTGPGDTLLALNQGDGVWKVVSYQPALNYGITALRGDPSGAIESAALFTRQDTAASNAGGRALVLAAGNYNLSSTVGGTEPNAYLLMPGAYFTGAGSLAANADPTVTATAGQTKFGLLGTNERSRQLQCLVREPRHSVRVLGGPADHLSRELHKGGHLQPDHHH